MPSLFFKVNFMLDPINFMVESKYPARTAFRTARTAFCTARRAVRNGTPYGTERRAERNAARAAQASKTKIWPLLCCFDVKTCHACKHCSASGAAQA